MTVVPTVGKAASGLIGETVALHILRTMPRSILRKQATHLHFHRRLSAETGTLKPPLERQGVQAQQLCKGQSFAQMLASRLSTPNLGRIGLPTPSAYLAIVHCSFACNFPKTLVCKIQKDLVKISVLATETIPRIKKAFTLHK